MRKKMSKKLMAVVLSAGMALSLAACGATDGDTTTPDTTGSTTTGGDTTTGGETNPGGETQEEGPLYTALTDENGNVYDLGGMEIIIRDWWSKEEDTEATNEYQEARNEYREWIQDTYNFKIKQIAISDWGSAPQDFQDYASQEPDDNNYVFVIRSAPATTSAMASGLMYDLSTLDCIDFSEAKWQSNKLHEQFSVGSKIYAMYAGKSEPRTGVYFNKQVLKDAGIEPESIYDMQKNGTWTWEEFENIMAQVQRDTDNDGQDDIFGLTLNEGNMVNAAVYSNNSEFIGKDENGYVYKFEDDATVEALEWVVDMFNKYDSHDPEGANWEYYKEEFLSGKVAFMVDDEYCGMSNSFLADVEFEVGFVMFPKGPKASTYVNCWSNNPAVIPANYDAERAWKIAFAYNMYTYEPAGYEDYIDLSAPRAGIFDSRAIDETIVMMMQPEHGMVTYNGFIPNLDMDAPFMWRINGTAVISEILESNSQAYQELVNQANGK